MSTKIEWAEETWQVLGGCTECSPGCQNCYARGFTHRLGHNPKTPQYAGLTDAQGHWTGEIRLLSPSRMGIPKQWKKPRRIFVQSMGDLFHEKVPMGWITHVLDTIQACPQHTFIMLTKRPENMRKALYGKWDMGRGHTWQYQSEDHVIPNLWLGVTVCTQAEADEKIPLLLQIPAAVRFVSVEPMLEAIDLLGYFLDPTYPDEPSIDWVIVGAETGPQKRHMELDWARLIEDQCLLCNVPFFFKKTSDGNHQLDGCTWEQFPEVK